MGQSKNATRCICDLAIGATLTRRLEISTGYLTELAIRERALLPSKNFSPGLVSYSD